MTSGWTAETFGDAQLALAFLKDSGTQLRAAVFAGAINLVFVALFLVGLAARLQATAPTPTAATLYLGVIGIAGESLIPLGLWLGVPTFVGLASHDPPTRRTRQERLRGLSRRCRGRRIPLPRPVDPRRRLGNRGAQGHAGPARPGRCRHGRRERHDRVSRGDPAGRPHHRGISALAEAGIIFRSWAGIELWKGEPQPALAGRQGQDG